MFHLKSVRLSAIDHERSAHFPFNVPVIRSLSGTEIEFLSKVTSFIGENGSGEVDVPRGAGVRCQVDHGWQRERGAYGSR